MQVLIALLGAIFFTINALAGTWTSNQFFYKPSLGARGSTEKNAFDTGLDHIDKRLGQVKYVGDPATGYDTFTNAVATLNADGGSWTLVVPRGTHNVSANFTVNNNIHLAIQKGATIVIADNKTLTISGSLDAGLYQIFSCTGTGKVVFGSGAVKEIHPEWWGAKGDGTTDDVAAVQAALTAAGGKAAVNITAGKTFAVGTPVVVPSNTVLQGRGTIKALTFSGSGGTGILSGDTKSGIVVRDITLDCNPSGQTTQSVMGIYLSGISSCAFRNLTVIGHYGGIYCDKSGATLCNNISIENCYIDNTGMTFPGPGIVLKGSNSKIINNYVWMQDLSSNQDSGSGHTGIVCNGLDASTGAGKNNVISGNTVKRGYVGIAGVYLQSSVISANTVSDQINYNSSSQGIYLTTPTNVVISNNSLLNVDYTAIALNDAINCVVGNNSIYMTTAGVNPTATRAITICPLTGTTSGCTITGNVIKGIDNSVAGGAGILLYGNNQVFTGNYLEVAAANCYSLVLYGTNCNVNGNRFSEGYLNIPNGGSGHKIADNVFSTSSAHAIQDYSNANSNEFSNNKLLSGDVYFANAQVVNDPRLALADAKVSNNSLYYSTTASKLCFKDGSGVVKALY